MCMCRSLGGVVSPESYRNMTRTIVSSAPFGVVNRKVVTGAPL